ncbi:MAG TPA: hypothetical protein VHA56_03175 [Mucilaginibacter sp.]|nr:hypothetical protein [Mucilaginibacter sp.]
MAPKATIKAAKAANKAVQPKTGVDTLTYGDVEISTSMKLKRRFVNDAYYAKMFIPAANYTQLNMIGLQLGVTWDEVLRGLIEQHLASADQISGLKNFIPALS